MAAARFGDPRQFPSDRGGLVPPSRFGVSNRLLPFYASLRRHNKE
jgi:hypothetical protein